MYRIVDCRSASVGAGIAREREIAGYESAYTALDALRDAVCRTPRAVSGWRLVDPVGTVLVEASDLVRSVELSGS